MGKQNIGRIDLAYGLKNTVGAVVSLGKRFPSTQAGTIGTLAFCVLLKQASNMYEWSRVSSSDGKRLTTRPRTCRHRARSRRVVYPQSTISIPVQALTGVAACIAEHNPTEVSRRVAVQAQVCTPVNASRFSSRPFSACDTRGPNASVEAVCRCLIPQARKHLKCCFSPQQA